MAGVQKYTFLKEFVSSLQLGFSVKIFSFFALRKETVVD